MRSLSALSLLLLPLALPAQPIVSEVGENDWGAYPDYNSDLRNTTFDFHSMAGTTNGALTITTNGVADIASRGILGTPLSSFVGATYRWEPGTWSMSLKLELKRTITFGRYTLSYTFGTLVYNPGISSSDWITTTVDSNTLWRLTSAKSGTKYNTLSGWLSDSRVGAATIGAIELGLGTSTPEGTYTGSVDWIDYSILSSGTLITEKVDFAAPIPEPATTAAVLATCGLGVALVARRRKQHR